MIYPAAEHNVKQTRAAQRVLKVTHTTIFKTNRSQAVRLPKADAFPDNIKPVEVIAVGRKRIIVPAGESWDDWFEGPSVSQDFMEDREQPKGQDREVF